MRDSPDTGERLTEANHVERGPGPPAQAEKPQSTDEQPSRLDAKTWLVERFNWTWFTCTQSTGGLAIILSECPKQFDGLHTIGAVVFVLNIILWLTFSGLTITRWILKPSKFRASFTQPPESYFYGSWWLTIATIIIGMQLFGVPHSGPWLITAIRVCFWIYAACTLLSSVVVFVIMSKHAPLANPGANPAILLTTFHAMLTGTIAAAIVGSQPPQHRLPIMIAGVGYQGYGWIMSTFLLSCILGCVLQNGFPPASSTRPGFFMLVGTAGYTIVVLIGNARGAPTDYGYFATHPMAAEILLVMATWTGVFLWVFTFWCFAIITLSIFSDMLKRSESGKWSLSMSFHNTWWAFIFPNVGFTLSTIYLGQEFESEAILWVATAMVILLVVLWIFDMITFFKAITYSIIWDSRVKLS
jgi:C4-dicarboxylate transporter/malic acid transport protein